MDITHSTTIPILQTERVLLRPLEVADFDAYAAVWADPVVTRFIGGRVFSREESWQRFLRQMGIWSVLGFGFWAVEDRATGRLLGEAGFHELKRQIVPSIEGAPEAGWGLVPDVHGKGLATEIVTAMHAWSDRTFSDARTVCIIHPENAGSIRVAEKCGYRRFADGTYRDAPMSIYERWPG